jgi:hypothetical protein
MSRTSPSSPSSDRHNYTQRQHPDTDGKLGDARCIWPFDHDSSRKPDLLDHWVSSWCVEHFAGWQLWHLLDRLGVWKILQG